MKLYFVRHGETSWNKLKRVQGHADIPLNEYGFYLAEQTANGLKDTPIDVAYTSPLIRARQTADTILKGRDIPVIEDERIQEIGFGEAEGMECREELRTPEVEEFGKFFWDPANYKVPKGGESIKELTDRVGGFLQELFTREDLKDSSVLVSTHGAALKAMMNYIKGNTDEGNFWDGGVARNCAVSEVLVENCVPKVLKEDVVYN